MVILASEKAIYKKHYSALPGKLYRHVYDPEFWHIFQQTVLATGTFLSLIWEEKFT